VSILAVERCFRLAEGNPVEDALIMTDYENNFDLIMKDGVIYKNTLGG